MKHASSSDVRNAASTGSQTLLRGLDVIDAVREQPLSLAQLSARLGLNRSTVHRLASALVERGYLRLLPRGGYMLGPKLLELGHAAREQLDLTRVARPLLEKLAEQTGDTVHLGVLAGDQALYLDKVPGRRRVEIGSRVGERHPLLTTGLGKALLLDEAQDVAREHFVARGGDLRRFTAWWKAMRRYADFGFTFDLEENEDRIRCVAAPLRDESGRVVAAISVSSAAQYMDGDRMSGLGEAVATTAQAVSSELGWRK
jgi:DNA-binding IclR family transcriptional regulator